MDNNDLKERDFEAYIEHWLLTEGGYTKGDQSTYDKERAIDLKTLVKFLRLTQTKKWELYEKKGLVEEGPFRPDTPFHKGCVGHHLRTGGHSLNRYDWGCYMDFADKHGWRGQK